MRATIVGRRVIDVIGDAFDRLLVAHQILTTDTAQRALRVAAPTSFVLGWMIEAVERFQEETPGTRIELEPLDDPLAARSPQPDVILCHARARPEGLGLGADWQSLSACTFRVVYSAERLRSQLTRPSDLQDLPLIRCDLRDGAKRGAPSWSDWLAAHDVVRPPFAPEIEVSQAYAAMRMAIMGQGVALLTRHLTEAAVRQGNLQELPGGDWHQGTALWSCVVAPQGLIRDQARHLQSWLQGELVKIYGPAVDR